MATTVPDQADPETPVPELTGWLTNLDELEAAVRARQGVLTTTMFAVRTAYGAGRLGVHVRDGISKALNGLGLGHFPDPLPIHQENHVRIYKLGSRAADLIDAVLHPGEAHDEELREAAGGEDAGVLKQIRELVCK